MSRAGDREIEIILEEAEKSGQCATPDDLRTRRLLERRLKTGELVSPMRDLFARPDYWAALSPEQQHLHKIRALQKLHPNWTFCGASAALLHGLSVSRRHLRQINVATNSGRRNVMDEQIVNVHLNEKETCVVNGIRATSLLRTTFDCMRNMDFRDGLAVADSALKVGGLSREDLVAYVSEKRGGYSGAPQARFTVRHADPRSGSGGESIARAAMLELGFAEPELQVPMRDPFTGQKRFADFGWRKEDGSLVLGELDGREKYVNPDMTGGADSLDVLRAERFRESRLTVDGTAVVRFSPQDVQNDVFFARLLDRFGVPRARPLD